MSRARGLAAVAMALLTALAMLPPGVTGAVPGADGAGGPAAAQAGVTAELTTPNDTVELNETFELNASGSTGNIDYYLWDYTEDGAPNRNTTSPVIYTYIEGPNATGEHTITVTVVGESGATDTATTEITVVENESDDGNETDPPGEDPPDGNETDPGDGNETDPGDGNETDPPDDGGDAPDDPSDGDDGDADTGDDYGPAGDQETTVSVDRPGDGVVAADVDATGGNVTVPLPSAGNGTAVAFDGMTVHLAQDNEFSVRATANATNGTGPSISGVETLATLSVSQQSLENWANGGATVTFSVPGERLASENVTPGAVSVYRQDDGNWTALNATVDGPTGVNESAAPNGTYEYSVTTDRFGTLAVAIDRPDLAVTGFELSGTDLEVGETLKATATVENHGRAPGQFEDVLTLDGTAIRNRSVEVPARGNKTVVFVVRAESAGEHELAIGNQSASYSVAEPETTDDGTTDDADDGTTETEPTTSQESTTTEAGMDASTMAESSSTTDGGQATESGGQPGFGAATALVALLAAALLAARRRP